MLDLFPLHTLPMQEAFQYVLVPSRKHSNMCWSHPGSIPIWVGPIQEAFQYVLVPSRKHNFFLYSAFEYVLVPFQKHLNMWHVLLCRWTQKSLYLAILLTRLDRWAIFPCGTLAPTFGADQILPRLLKAPAAGTPDFDFVFVRRLCLHVYLVSRFSLVFFILFFTFLYFSLFFSFQLCIAEVISVLRR